MAGYLHGNKAPVRLPQHDAAAPASLISSRVCEGQLPLVLTAPHGGNETDGEQQSSFVPRPDVPGVSILQDVGTAALLEEIDRRVLSKIGQVNTNCINTDH
jgi:hypothetical protein